MAALVAFLVFVTCGGCAPQQSGAAPHLRSWAYDRATVIVPVDAPPCALWTVQQAWEFLAPRPAVTIQLGWPHSPAVGEIVVDWSEPRGAALGLTTTYGDAVTWQRSRHVTRAEVQVSVCAVRLLAHEMGHALGLVNVEREGMLMHRVYDDGGWLLSPAEVAVLRGK